MNDAMDCTSATEDDVRQALEETAFYGFPQDDCDLLRFFEAMLDVLAKRSLRASVTIPT